MRNRTGTEQFPALVLGLGLALCPTAPAQTFTTIDYPGAVATVGQAINNRGEVLGTYTDAAGRRHGFLLTGGRYTSLDCEGAASTFPRGLNNHQEITGKYVDAEGKAHGFYMGELGGQCFTIDPKGAAGGGETTAGSINDAGEIAGQYNDAEGRYHAYLWRGGVFLVFDIVDGSPWNGGALAINEHGDIAGHFTDTSDGRMKGFLLTKTKLSVIEFPPGESNSMSCGFGMNNRGDIAGHYQRVGGPVRGFGLIGGKLVEIDYPDAAATTARSINDQGWIVGEYTDKDKNTHGFLLR